ncbi:hypothetical protein MPTK1_3g09280 [Marchantia polymorpha subsp. ruderalis]|uniref:Uncharacterized protein n=2 Tax=Marchantia polymorpha TaxID=3197 RepID=A0AAF6AYZ7_MARPO|nr:hypothetical protein MARPO_0085s0101 [Marchantia polymorpha]BBN04981.1 hypothetical protein Mp_3g09280 [Marchantia polymorpha subsp. ruderalis]|eukprot:PTQ33898.1 hypothetical protein MARPO_0085s0101 [Marchantia polymorpha]
MVRSIQPEWIAGPVPPPRAQETINGIYWGYVKEKNEEHKSWHQQFRKPWELGRHKRDFCGQIRTSRTDDHKYVFYLPGREARDHHLKCVDETNAWRARTLLNENVKAMLAKNFACEKKRHYFDTMKRHKEEQQALWSKAKKKLLYIKDEDVASEAPRARDLPEFNPLKPFEEIKLGIAKCSGVFYPQYVNLPALGRYMANLDSVKRGLVAALKDMPGKVPNLMGNFATELELNSPSAESGSAALDLLEIPIFESKLASLVAELKAKQALQPVIKDADRYTSSHAIKGVRFS